MNLDTCGIINFSPFPDSDQAALCMYVPNSGQKHDGLYMVLDRETAVKLATALITNMKREIVIEDMPRIDLPPMSADEDAFDDD